MAQTGSFIPKQAKPTAAQSRTRTVRKVYLFSYISYVVFFGTLLVVAGMFLYEIHLNNNLSSQKAMLAVERDSFSQSDIERVRELDSKLITAQQLFSAHVSSKFLLEGFEETVLADIQFTSFSFTREPDGSYLLAASGVTNDFDSLLFQRQVLKGDDLFAAAEISNIAYAPGSADDLELVDAESKVSFELKKVLSAADISFVQAQQISNFDTNEFGDTNQADPDIILFDDAGGSNPESGDEFFDTESIEVLSGDSLGESVDERFEQFNPDFE